MTSQFISEIGVFGFNFAPRKWSICDGQLLPVGQNPALYSLIGNQWGGQAPTTFQLPQLQGRVAVGDGKPEGTNQTYTAGQMGGSQYVTLSEQQMASHSHSLFASGQNGDRVGNKFGNSQIAKESQATAKTYAPPVQLVDMNPNSIETTGQGQSHYNVQPYQTVLFCIAIDGTYPSRN